MACCAKNIGTYNKHSKSFLTIHDLKFVLAKPMVTSIISVKQENRTSKFVLEKKYYT